MAAIEVHSLCLAIGPFIPIEPNPLHSLNNGLDRFIGRAALVRVFDTEDKHAILLAGKEPIEQRRTNTADVQKAGGTRRKSNSDLCHAFNSSNLCEGWYL